MAGLGHEPSVSPPSWVIATAAEPIRLVQTRNGSVVSFACRLGVQSVDLQVALGRGDTARARRVTSEIIDELAAVGLSGPVVQRYRQIRSRLAIDSPAQRIQRASIAPVESREMPG